MKFPPALRRLLIAVRGRTEAYVKRAALPMCGLRGLAAQLTGVALALPGGAIGRRFGDKTTVLGALILMLIGTLAMALSDSWSGQIAGRLVGGAGGVLLNVQMTKMVADWFAGREIATAMAIFVNSWPAGIALSLLTLPLIGTAYGVSAVYFAVAALIGFGLVLLAATYRHGPCSSRCSMHA